jgi:isocitrate dehydrogenase kinase/phosphatase
MNALRLLALTDGAEPGFNHRVMDWHDVVMGQTDRINLDNERKSLVMLQSICECVSKQTIYEIDFLSVSFIHVLSIYITVIYSSLSLEYH